jgi:hypothetical protein
MKAVVTTSWIMSVLVVALYEALIYLPLLQSYKWELLIVEIAIALAGVLLSVAALCRRRWQCIFCLAICGYVLFRQLVA